MTPESLDGLRPLFDSLSDGVCVADEEGRLLYANEAAGRLLGVTREQAQAETICSLLCERLAGCDGARCPLRNVGGAEDAVTFEGDYEGAPERPRLRVRCLRARRPRGERHFLIIEDARDEAAAAQRRDDWRHMFAHDLRSPLTNVVGVLRVIEERGPGQVLEEKDLDMLRLAARSCERIQDLLDAYLTVARMGSGRMPVHASTLELGAFLRECVVEESVKAVARGRELECGACGPLWATADPELLRRCVTNLVDNALKFTMAGGLVRLSARAADAWAEILVEDDGPGISPEDLPHVFDRFYQARGVPRDVGFGLGLTFCREAVRAMGGEIEAESQPGHGSAFTLRVPAASEPRGGAS